MVNRKETLRKARYLTDDENDDEYHTARDVNGMKSIDSQKEEQTDDESYGSYGSRQRSNISKKEVRAIVKFALKEASTISKLNKEEEPTASSGSFDSSGQAIPRSELKLFIACAIAYIIFLAFIFTVLLQHVKTELPYIDLQLFSKMTSRDLQSNGAVGLPPYNGTTVEAVATCVTADDEEGLKNAIDRELRPIRSPARDKLLRMIAVREVSAMDSIIDTADDGDSATTYMAFWSTSYNGKVSPFSPRYASCFMVASHTYDIELEIIDWIVTNKQQLVGARYCNCGLSICPRLCFMYEMTERQFPIFEPGEFTVGHSVALHRLLAKSAVKKAMQVQKQEPMFGSALRDRFYPQLARLSWDVPKPYGVGKKESEA